VAKILVADDNSNIQKMVGLALKDQGIDVVAVGNGEAAVRKISDIRPDLVLADVFMPVRNGYEVCQYVKTDPSLAHIPVILLVGAFDPLDEQEAQRVGADGVLKKPFVPPDPLISMVKSALARAGVSLTGAPATATPAPTPRPASDLLMNPNVTPRTLPSVHPITGPAQGPGPMSISLPALTNDPLPEEMPVRPAPVKIDAGGSPLAFGNLLGSTVTQEEEDPGFATPALPQRDWRSSDEHDAEEELEEAPKASWRRDVGDEAFGGADKAPSVVSDWRETVAVEAPAVQQHSTEWSPTKEKTGFVEAEDVPETVPAAVVETVLSDVKTSAPAAPFAGDAWAAAIAAGSDDKTSVATEEVAPAPVAAVQEAPAEVPATIPAAQPEEPVSKKSSLTSSWFQTSSSPWEAEAQKASQLASTWDAPAIAAVAPEVPQAAAEAPARTHETHQEPAAFAATDNLVEPAVESASVNGDHSGSAYAAHDPELQSVPEPAAVFEKIQEQVSLSPETVEAIREEAVHVTEATHHDVLAAAQQEAAAETSAAPSTPEPNLDELVAKVLAKMSPDVLQAVTRDILKSVVEGIVRDELNSKKP
jgi:CheY-like chemotaxis protein